MSATWGSWVMLILLLILIFNRFFIEDIAIVFRGLFSKSERLYLDSSWQRDISAWVYRVGIVSFVIYLSIAQQMSEFAFEGFLKVLGCVGVLMFLQEMLERFVGVVFLSPRQQEPIFKQRICICNSISAILWLCVLLIQWIDSVVLTNVVCCIVAGVFLLLVLLKSIQLLYKKMLSILYILLYIISLEVVPLVATISIVKYVL